MPLRALRSAVPALAALLGLGPVAVAAEPPTPSKPWDQAAVAKLAADLARACTHLYDEFYAEQGVAPRIGSGDEVERFRLQHKLQRIEEQTMSLAGALAAGKGRAETTPSVEDVGELADDSRTLLSRMFVEIPLSRRIDAARAIWLQLLPYYGIAPPAGAPAPQP